MGQPREEDMWEEAENRSEGGQLSEMDAVLENRGSYILAWTFLPRGQKSSQYLLPTLSSKHYMLSAVNQLQEESWWALSHALEVRGLWWEAGNTSYNLLWRAYSLVLSLDKYLIP